MVNPSNLPPKKHIALYARVSTDMQQGGMESQVRVLKALCESQGIVDYELFMDEGISGTKASRPALDRMMAAVRDHQISTVIVSPLIRPII